jgi:hypothetical protein
MACSPYNPCHTPTCDTCNTVNPCYDNCGCLNPTTFDCITNFKKAYNNIPLEINATGQDMLDNLDETVAEIESNLYKVKVDDSDTCPDTLLDKITAGSNITVSVAGSGCNRKLTITAGNGITTAPDIYAKVSSNDTTSDYLGNKFVDGTYVKKSVNSPGGNETIDFDITIADLISTDSGNQLGQGVDGKLKTLFSAPDGSETKINPVANSGITLTGTGTNGDPYLIGTNGALFAVQPYTDGVWRTLTFNNGSNANVTLNSQSVKYRMRYDGSVEFKGSLNYSVTFNVASTNKIAITAANITTGGSTNLPSTAFDRVANLRHYMTFSSPNTISATPKLTGYNVNILAAALNSPAPIQIEFMNDTAETKNIVVTMDGAIYHPNI